MIPFTLVITVFLWLVCVSVQGYIFFSGSNSGNKMGIQGKEFYSQLTPLNFSMTSIQHIEISVENTFLLKDNNLYVAGNNIWGTMFKGYASNETFPHFTRVDNLKIESLRVGEKHVLYLKNDSNAYVLGNNQYGQLGLPLNLINETYSTPLLYKENITKISTGVMQSFVVTKENQVFSSGRNEKRELGHSLEKSLSYEKLVVPLPANHQILEIYGSPIASHSLVLLQPLDGGKNVLFGWGNNQYNANFDDYSGGNPKNLTINQLLEDDVKKVCVGETHTMLITTAHDLYGSGYNIIGEAGDSTIYSSTFNYIFVYPQFAKQVVDLSCGKQTTMILTKNGRLFRSGRNDVGQLGTGDTQHLFSFTEFPLNPIAESLRAYTENNGNLTITYFITGSKSSVFVTKPRECFNKTVNAGCENGWCVAEDTCSCYSGYIGETCQTIACNDISKFDSTVCSQHGQCLGPNTCSCEIEYMGNDCQFPNRTCSGYSHDHPKVCTGHGECSAYDHCQCDLTYNSTHPGECDSCSSPYYIYTNEKTCEYCNCFSQGSTSLLCNEKGQCSCKPGFTGTKCNSYHSCNNIPFFDAGVCNGKGNCTENNACQCSTGYEGSECETKLFKCFGLKPNEINVCSGHGTCETENKCSCINGFKGDQCETEIVASCYEFEAADERVCSSHGQCMDDNDCHCSDGYQGDSCNICPPNTYDIGTSCIPCQCNVANSKSQQCNANGICTCNSDFEGIQCNDLIITKNTSTCVKEAYTSSICSFNGVLYTCSKNTQTKELCECFDGYDGDSCIYNTTCIDSIAIQHVYNAMNLLITEHSNDPSYQDDFLQALNQLDLHYRASSRKCIQNLAKLRTSTIFFSLEQSFFDNTIYELHRMVLQNNMTRNHWEIVVNIVQHLSNTTIYPNQLSLVNYQNLLQTLKHVACRYTSYAFDNTNQIHQLINSLTELYKDTSSFFGIVDPKFFSFLEVYDCLFTNERQTTRSIYSTFTLDLNLTSISAYFKPYLLSFSTNGSFGGQLSNQLSMYIQQPSLLIAKNIYRQQYMSFFELDARESDIQLLEPHFYFAFKSYRDFFTLNHTYQAKIVLEKSFFDASKTYSLYTYQQNNWTLSATNVESNRTISLPSSAIYASAQLENYQLYAIVDNPIPTTKNWLWVYLVAGGGGGLIIFLVSSTFALCCIGIGVKCIRKSKPIKPAPHFDPVDRAATPPPQHQNVVSPPPSIVQSPATCEKQECND